MCINTIHRFRPNRKSHLRLSCKLVSVDERADLRQVIMATVGIMLACKWGIAWGSNVLDLARTSLLLTFGAQPVLIAAMRTQLLWGSHRPKFALLFLLLPTFVASLTSITDANIAAAVSAWRTSPSTATTTYGLIADWDTSAVISMHGLFWDHTSFNGDISRWNTGSVSLMSFMFFNAGSFNQNIGGWNTGSVTSMERMFYRAYVFNQNIGRWNTVRLVGNGLNQMFWNDNAFDQNIASWNVLRVTDLNHMFDGSALSGCNKGAIYRHWGATLRTAYPGFSSTCGASCSLTCLIDGNVGTAATAWITSPSTAATTYGPIADWDVSAVSNMYQLFYNKPTFNADIGKWNVASVSNMMDLFLSATAFNGNIGSWNVASVTNVQGMFFRAPAFNANIGAWNTALVTTMQYMFESATAFNQDIGAWNVARVVTMSNTFKSASAFNADIGAWNTAFVTIMEEMFYKAATFNRDMSKWNVASVTVFTGGPGWGMFNGASAFDQNLASWNVLRATSFTANFDSTTALSSCNKGAIYRHWGATLRTAYPGFSSTCGASCSLTCLIDGNVGTAATAWITSPSTAATTYGPIADWDVSAVSNMYQLFYNKPTFNADIGKWNVASVTDMQYMFYHANAFNQDIGSWNTARVINMQGMFQSATAFNVNIGSWNSATATSMASMFAYVTAFNQNIGGWNVAAVTDFESIFNMHPSVTSSTTFDQNIASWNVASATNFNAAFQYSKFNQDISRWNVASVSNIRQMFYVVPAFNANIAAWNVLRVSNLVSAFDSASALSSCNKGAIYLAWGTTLRTAYPTFLSIASISSFSPLNTQVSGAATVTVLGANFLCSDLSPSAYISGQPCATTAWTTTTQLVCSAPAPVLVGASRKAWVQVFINTASSGFTFDGTTFAEWNRFGP
jgi:surface protein